MVTRPAAAGLTRSSLSILLLTRASSPSTVRAGLAMAAARTKWLSQCGQYSSASSNSFASLRKHLRHFLHANVISNARSSSCDSCSPWHSAQSNHFRPVCACVCACACRSVSCLVQASLPSCLFSDSVQMRARMCVCVCVCVWARGNGFSGLRHVAIRKGKGPNLQHGDRIETWALSMCLLRTTPLARCLICALLPSLTSNAARVRPSCSNTYHMLSARRGHVNA